MEEKDKDMNLAEENQEFSFETNENVIEESEVSVNDEEVIVVTEEENAPEEEAKGAKKAWKTFVFHAYFTVIGSCFRLFIMDYCHWCC